MSENELNTELLRRIADNDENAFTFLYRQYSKRIFDVCMTYLHDVSVSGDIVQEVFIRVWEKRESFADVKQPEDFLFIIARNRIFDHFRRKAVAIARESLIASQSMSVNDAGHRVQEKEYEHLLRHAVSCLPPARKKIFLLAREHGLSYVEIAQKLNLSRFTVKNQMKEALHTLRGFLNQHRFLLVVAFLVS